MLLSNLGISQFSTWAFISLGVCEYITFFVSSLAYKSELTDEKVYCDQYGTRAQTIDSVKGSVILGHKFCAAIS